jgi:hypothetical protein
VKSKNQAIAKAVIAVAAFSVSSAFPEYKLTIGCLNKISRVDKVNALMQLTPYIIMKLAFDSTGRFLPKD